MMRAGNFLPSAVATLMCFAPNTTWVLVTMSPFSSIRNPEPVPPTIRSTVENGLIENVEMTTTEGAARLKTLATGNAQLASASAASETGAQPPDRISEATTPHLRARRTNPDEREPSTESTFSLNELSRHRRPAFGPSWRHADSRPRRRSSVP